MVNELQQLFPTSGSPALWIEGTVLSSYANCCPVPTSMGFEVTTGGRQPRTKTLLLSMNVGGDYLVPSTSAAVIT